jgi:flagellar motor switch protein FliG
MVFDPLRLRAGFAVLLLAGSVSAAVTPKEASRELEAKVSLESSLEKRLQSVLREALGSDDLIVIVNVALRSETEAKDDSEVMPGVPVKEAQAADALSAAGLSMPMVSRISATIIMDQDTEAKDADLAKKVAEGILGISAGRGDSLTVEKIKFHKPHVQPDTSRWYALAGSGLWLLFAVVALIVVQRRFLGPLVANLRDLSAAALMRKNSEERGPAEERQGAAAAEGKTSSSTQAAAATGRAGLPFSFLEKRDLPKLIHLLRGSTDEAAATVIQYLPPDMAVAAIAGLETEPRRQVVTLLSRVNELVESQVRPLEESVRQRIDYMIGGEDKLVELLEPLPLALQTDLLATLRSEDPDVADGVSRRLVFIDDLAELEPAEIKLLSRRVPAKLLAVVLKSSAILRLSVLPKLASGTREWLTQEIELSQNPTPEALDAARRPVIAALSDLVREGRIVLRKKEAPPALAPADPTDAVPQEV